MATSAVDLGDWAKFQQQFEKVLGEDRLAIVEKGATAAVVQLDSLARNALPPPPRKQAQPFKTAKQRRWWWGVMHRKAQGKSRELPGWKAAYQVTDGQRKLVLSGSYKRTGKLPQSLTYEVRTEGEAVTARYGTNLRYGPWVLDKDRQSRYHSGNWPTLQGITLSNADVLVKTFADVVTKEVADYIGAK